jgi:hypothetical protein
LLVGCVLALGAEPARAHDRGTVYSRWSFAPSGASVTVDVPWDALVGLDPRLLAALRPETLSSDATAAALVATSLLDGFAAAVGGRECTPSTPPAALPAAPGRLARRWSLDCPAAGPVSILNRQSSGGAGALLHLVRVEIGGAGGASARVAEHAFAAGDDRWLVPLSGEASHASLRGFLLLGVEHILSGADHLLFLCGLLLVTNGLGEIARVVTGFTVAHSLTLAAGVLGVAHPPPHAIEALIGLSIVVVALEYFYVRSLAATRRWILAGLVAGLAGLGTARTLAAGVVPLGALAGFGVFGLAELELLELSPRPGLWRWLVAFAFGLIHGFGFAGTLIDLDLPRGSLAVALAGFNAGVECGQLLVVLLVVGLARAVSPRLTPWAREWARDLVAAGVLFGGWVWFLARGLAG